MCRAGCVSGWGFVARYFGCACFILLVLHLLLLHVEQCVSACAVCVCGARCSSPLEQFCETSLQQMLDVSG